MTGLDHPGIEAVISIRVWRSSARRSKGVRYLLRFLVVAMLVIACLAVIGVFYLITT